MQELELKMQGGLCARGGVKMQGGLCARGGVIAGFYGNSKSLHPSCDHIFDKQNLKSDTADSAKTSTS